MATKGKKIEALSSFLRESFEQHDLERFLVTKGYEEVADAVDRAAGMVDYAFNIVRELDRRGLVDAAFFDRLTEERPAKKEPLGSLAAVWLDEDQTRPKQPSPGAGFGGMHSPALKELDGEIRSILRPLMGDRDSRRARLSRAFKGYPGLLDRIGVDGQTGVFLDLLIDTLEAYGDVEPGKSAVCVLLDSVKGEVGLRDQERIERMIRAYHR